jgi:phosphatidylserine/phosphatidylglycerophosphate/cardiolipin synthase-like enzyme
LIKQLHAKLYLVGRKEVIVTSANLSRGGFEGNIEAGVWSNYPLFVEGDIEFVERRPIH